LSSKSSELCCEHLVTSVLFPSFQALQADCVAHRELLERLEEKASNVNDAHPQSRVLDLRSRYSAVTTALKELLSRLDGQVGSHEEYRKAYIGCLDWMANTRHRLQRLSDFSGDRRSLQDRLQQLKVTTHSCKELEPNLINKHLR